MTELQKLREILGDLREEELLERAREVARVVGRINGRRGGRPVVRSRERMLVGER